MKAQPSEGPKNERTKLNSNLDGSHEGKTPKTAGSDNCGHYSPDRQREVEAVKPWRTTRVERWKPTAKAVKESDVRATDGTSRQ